MVPMRIEPETVLEFRSLCASCAASLLSGLLAVWNGLLLHLCDQTELIFGQPYSMRESPGLEGVVGCFINFLPVRVVHPTGTNIPPTIRETQRALANAIDHGDVPIQEIVKALPRSTSGSMRSGVALYETMLQLIDAPAAAPMLSEREPVESDLSGLLLRVTLFPSEEGGVAGVLNFPSDLFEVAQATGLVQAFQGLLASAVRGPESAHGET